MGELRESEAMVSGCRQMRVYGYTRVSTEEQVRGGVSLEMQADRIRAYAVSQGWNLVRIFEDAGHSGTTLERPGLQAMLLRLKSIGAVLVYKVDRLSRRQKHVLNLLEDVFEPCGVRFKSVTETFDTTTPSGRAMLGMISTFSQLERDTVAQRTRDALRNKQANGGHVGAPAYGFRVVDHSLVAVPEELAIVREVKLLRVDGKTLRNIARSLIAVFQHGAVDDGVLRGSATYFITARTNKRLG